MSYSENKILIKTKLLYVRKLPYQAYITQEITTACLLYTRFNLSNKSFIIPIVVDMEK